MTAKFSPIRSLADIEALERNQFHRLPGGIFNRGFVRAVTLRARVRLHGVMMDLREHRLDADARRRPRRSP